MPNENHTLRAHEVPELFGRMVLAGDQSWEVFTANDYKYRSNCIHTEIPKYVFQLIVHTCQPVMHFCLEEIGAELSMYLSGAAWVPNRLTATHPTHISRTYDAHAILLLSAKSACD